MIVAENNMSELETVTLKEKVDTDTPLKKWLVEYAGRKFQTEVNKLKVEKNEEVDWNGDITVEMIVGVMATEFPEFVLAVAEENFIRGYRQAFTDMEAGMELANAQVQNDEPS